MKNDIEYEKGRKIAEEIALLMKSKEANLLSEELQEWALFDESATNVIEKFSDAESLQNASLNFNKKERGDDVANLINSIQTKEKRKRHIRLVKITASIAAALLCVSFFVYNATLKSDAEKELLSKIELNDTVFKPTLILNSGQSIDLISDEKVLNDVAVKKIGENKLTYDSTVVSEQTTFNTLVVPKLFTYSVELSDGTTVYLNANSELKYPVQFNQDKREVYLKGEAYFDVVKGEKPFIIHASDMKVQVYGTQFNINAYNKTAIKTALIEGSVGVRSKDGEQVMMKPNQMAEVTRDGKISVKEVDATQYTAWLNGDISSHNAPLADLLDKISAWYGVEFNSTINIQGINVTTSLSNKLSLEKILKGIGETTNLKIIKNGESKYMIE